MQTELNFDITAAPPTEAAIEADLARLEVLRTRLEQRAKYAWVLNIFWTCCLLGGTAVILFGGGLPIRGWHVEMLLGTAFFPFMLLWLRSLEDRLHELNGIIRRLSPLDSTICGAVLALCRQHEMLARYQTQVAQQGRALTGNEANLMQQWARETETRAACLALLSPVQAKFL